MPTQGLILCRDQRVSAVFRSVFDSEGITLRCLSLVGDGKSLLEKNKYDAVIVDCDELQDGYDLLAALRNCRSNKSSIAFAITGEKAEVKTAYDAGATFVLEKPITTMGVSKAVRAASGLILRERHRYFRHPINVSTCVIFYGEDLENEVHLLNVSQGGLAVASDVPRRVEGNVAVRFQLPDSKSVIVVKGRVVWSKDQTRFGIEFASLANLSRKELNTWLARQACDPPAPAKEVTATAAAPPVRVKSPPIVPVPSLPAASRTKSGELEVLPLAGFQAATPVRVHSRSASTTSIQYQKTGSSRKRSKSLLVLLAALGVSVGGWMATNGLPHDLYAASSPLPKKTVDGAVVVNHPAPVAVIKPSAAKVLPITTAENSSVPVFDIRAAQGIEPADAPVSDIQNATPMAEKTQVLDLLATRSAMSGRKSTENEATLEAPSLGAVSTSHSATNLVSGIASMNAAAPVLTRTSVVEPEVLIHKVAPVYPTLARNAHVNGEVIVKLTIAKDGSVKNPVIESGHSMLRGAVLEAVRQWKYTPYKVNNEPREIQTLVSVKFR